MLKLYFNKLTFCSFLFFTAIFIFSGSSYGQNNSVSIGTTDIKQNAILWLNGDGGQGLLLPAVASLGNISSPDAGMIVYQTSDNKLYYRNASAWVEVGGSGGGGSYGLSFNAATGEVSLVDGGSNLTVTLTLNGDVTGSLNSAQLAAGSVGTNELAQMGAANGDILQYNSGTSSWEAVPNPSGFSGDYNDLINAPSIPANLNDLSDVVASSPTSGQVLKYNGSNWIADTDNSGGAPSVDNVTIELQGGTTLGVIDGGITSTQLAASSVIGGAGGIVQDGSITTEDIADGSLSDADISSSAGVAVSKLSGGTNGQVLTTVGGVPTWQPSVTGTSQDLSISGDNLSLSGDPTPAAIDLSGYLDNTDSQNLSYSGAAGSATANEVFNLDIAGGTGVTLTEGTNIAITRSGSNLTINSTGSASGEANTASNLGAGVGVFNTKSGDDLQFNSINTGSPGVININDDSGNGEIDIAINQSALSITSSQITDAGTIVTQDANSVNITGGTVSGVVASGTFTGDGSGLTGISSTVNTVAGKIDGDGSGGSPLNIASNAITASELADGAVSGGVGGKITDNTITGADISLTADIIANSFTGDGSSLTGVNAEQIRGNAIDPALSPVLDEVLKWDGTQWTAQPDVAAGSPNTFAGAGNPGIVPDPVTESGNFLRDDGTWAVPAGAGDMIGANNLSELTNAGTARTNLGLGSLSTLNTVTSAEITDNSITGTDISSTANITANSFTGDGSGLTGVSATVNTDVSKITGDGSVGTPLTLAAGAITATEMASGAVAGGAGGTISDNTITGADISTTADIIANSFSGDGSGLTGISATVNTTAGKIDGDGSGGSPLTIATGAVTATELANGAVSGGTGGVITDNTITGADISTTADIVANSFSGDGSGLTGISATVNTTSGKIDGDGSGGSPLTIATGAVTATELANGAVSGGTGGVITDNTITGADISTTADIVANSFSGDGSGLTGISATVNTTSGKIDGDGSGGSPLTIATGAVTATELANGAVSGGTGGIITDNTITGADISSTADITANSFTGDGSALTGINAEQIRATAIDPTLSPALNEVLKWDGTQWTAQPDVTGGSPATFTGAGNPGIVPDPITETGNFLRDDGTWAAPAGAGDMIGANNLSELTNTATARTNLGLGAVAVLDAISSTEITDNSITGADISTTADITANSFTGDGSGLTGVSATVSVDGTTVNGDGAGTPLNIPTGGITTNQIFDGTVTTTDIADGTIVDADVAVGAAIDVSKIAGIVDNDASNEIQNLSQVVAQGNSAGNSTIIDVNDPINPQDAATKNYVDNNATTASNGITLTGNDVALGGNMTQSTTIAGAANDLYFDNFNELTIQTDVFEITTLGGDFLAGKSGQNFVIGNNAGTTAFRYNDGNQAVGSVLTSDATGVASWQVPAVSPWNVSAPDINFTGGNVGIGIAAPTNNLHLHQTSGINYMQVTDAASGTAFGDGLLVGMNGSGQAFILNQEANNLNLGASADVFAMSINQNGFVGINSTSPGSTFEVREALNQDRVIVSDGRNVSLGDIDGGGAGASLFIDGDGAGNFQFTGGNVGIGVTNPPATLAIGENYTTPVGDESVYLARDGGDSYYETASGDMSEGLVMHGSGAGESGIVRNLFSSGFMTGRATGLHIFNRTADPIMWSTNNAEHMRLTSAGNIGIGTTSPSAKLHINSGSSSTPLILDNTVSGNTILDMNNNGSLAARLQVTTSQTNLLSQSTRDISFYTNGVERLNIDGASHGNVGMGTDGDSFRKLYVRGSSSEQYALTARTDYTGSNAAQAINLIVSAGSTGLKYGANAQVLAGSSTSNIYGYYASMTAGTGDAYGFYSTGEDFNYFSGDVGVGTTSPIAKLHVQENTANYVARFVNGGLTNADGIIVRAGPATPTTGTYFVLFQDGANGFTDGSIRATGSGGVQYNTTSDRRLKQNITDLENSLGIVMEMKPRDYEFIANPAQRESGFIAQELIDVYPQAVSGDPEGDVDTEPMMVDYSKLTPVLTGAIQQQQEIIEKQSEQISELKKEIEALKNAQSASVSDNETKSELESVKAELAEIKAMLMKAAGNAGK